jgi:gas vesicle protein
MGKIILFLGVVIGAAIFSIALIGAPAAGSVAREMQTSSQTGVSAGCHVEEFALDEGYGVSRKTTRTVCPRM